MISLPEAARSLGVAPDTLRQQIKKGKLHAVKLARDWFLTAEEVERYRVEHRRADSDATPTPSAAPEAVSDGQGAA